MSLSSMEDEWGGAGWEEPSPGLGGWESIGRKGV